MKILCSELDFARNKRNNKKRGVLCTGFSLFVTHKRQIPRKMDEILGKFGILGGRWDRRTQELKMEVKD